MKKFSVNGINKGEVYVLDAEETELLHINYTFSKIYEESIVQFRFDGVRPIVGTDLYDVGICRINGKQGTILCTKENIKAAQSSSLQPLIEVASPHTQEQLEEQPKTISVVEINKAQQVRIGAFSSYVFN